MNPVRKRRGLSTSPFHNLIVMQPVAVLIPLRWAQNPPVPHNEALYGQAGYFGKLSIFVPATAAFLLKLRINTPAGRSSFAVVDLNPYLCLCFLFSHYIFRSALYRASRLFFGSVRAKPQDMAGWVFHDSHYRPIPFPPETSCIPFSCSFYPSNCNSCPRRYENILPT